MTLRQTLRQTVLQILRHPRAALTLVAVALLGACGNTADLGSTAGTIAGTVRQAFAQRNAPPPLRPVGAFPGLDPALVAGRAQPTMGVWMPSREALAEMGALTSQAGRTYWRTGDNAQFVLTGGGVVTSTRGLGVDLHAATADQSIALIEAGHPGTAARRHTYLDAQYRPVNLRLTCQIVPSGAETIVLNGRSLPTLRIDETCTGDGASFSNTYWRDARGPLIRQSVQWVGPEVGPVYLQRLVE